jgi:hypothetical protein
VAGTNINARTGAKVHCNPWIQELPGDCDCILDRPVRPRYPRSTKVRTGGTSALFYLAALFGIVALVAVVYGGVRIVRGSRARGIAMIAAGVLLFGGSVWIFLAEQERLDFDRQLKEQAGQPDILPYPDD